MQWVLPWVGPGLPADRRLSRTPLATLTPEEAAGLSDLREVLGRLRG